MLNVAWLQASNIRRHLSIWAKQFAEAFIMLIPTSNLFLTLNSNTFADSAEVCSPSRWVKARQMPTSTDKRQSSNGSEKASSSCNQSLHKAKFKHTTIKLALLSLVNYI